MKRDNLQNKKLEQIERDLFEVTRLSDEKIKNIVANPNLFASIENKIKIAENKELNKEAKLSLAGFGWMQPLFENRQLALSAFAILVILTIFMTVITFSNQDSNEFAQKTVEETQTKVIKSQKSIAPTEVKEKESFADEKQTAIKNEKIKTQRFNKKTISAKPSKVSKKKVVKTKRQQKPKATKPNLSQMAENQTPKVFYSLPFNENRTIANENLQVVRTEISRSELFALGLKVQLENVKPKIKAELLVDMDGKARALRLVE